MLTHPTIDKLMALRLPAFAEACQRQLGNPEFTALSFEDRLGLLVDAEWTQREQRKLRRRLRHANLRRQAVLEDIDRFLLAMHRLEGLNHQMIVPVLSSGLAGPRPYVVTEFIMGPNTQPASGVTNTVTVTAMTNTMP